MLYFSPPLVHRLKIFIIKPDWQKLKEHINIDKVKIKFFMFLVLNIEYIHKYNAQFSNHKIFFTKFDIYYYEFGWKYQQNKIIKDIGYNLHQSNGERDFLYLEI